MKVDTEKIDVEKENKEVMEDCKTCKFCLDKQKFGGKGRLKKAFEEEKKVTS